MPVRAIRGAVCLQRDEPEEMREAVAELLTAMLSRNALDTDCVVSMLLTSTADLVSAFPAVAARSCGFSDVPLMCAQEIEVRGALPRVVRVMMHVDTDLARDQIEHVYLRGAEVLRPDLQR